MAKRACPLPPFSPSLRAVGAGGDMGWLTVWTCKANTWDLQGFAVFLSTPHHVLFSIKSGRWNTKLFLPPPNPLHFAGSWRRLFQSVLICRWVGCEWQSLLLPAWSTRVSVRSPDFFSYFFHFYFFFFFPLKRIKQIIWWRLVTSVHLIMWC